METKNVCWVCGCDTGSLDLALCKSCDWSDFEGTCHDCGARLDGNTAFCRDALGRFFCKECDEKSSI